MQFRRSQRISVAVFTLLTPMMFAFQNCSPSTLSTAVSTQGSSTNNGQSSGDTGGNTPATGGTTTSPIAGSRSAYIKIEAESFDSQFGFQLVPNALGYASVGDYAVYNNIDFGSSGAKSVKLSLGAPASVAGRKFEIRLSSATGELISEVTVQSTGGYAIFQDQSVNLNRTVTGVQTVVLVMKGDDFVDIDAFTFSTATIVIPPVVNPRGGTYSIVGTSYHVSVYGNDSNSGLTPNSPFRTIYKASSVMKAGDAALIMNGDYSEPINPPLSGQAGKPLVYKNYGTDKPRIYGGSGDQANLSGKQYIIIDGLTFENAGLSWINMQYGSHLRVINSSFKTAYGWNGISMTGTSYSNFAHNTLTATCVGGAYHVATNGVGGPDNLLDGYGDMHHNVVEENVFGYATHYAIDIQGGYYNIIRNNRIRNPWHAGIGLFSGSGARVDENLVEGNIILDTGSEKTQNLCESVPTPSWDWEYYRMVGIQISATRSIVRRNLILRNGGNNLTSFGIPTYNNRIYNNTFSSGGTDMYIWCSADRCDNNIFINNIFNNESVRGFFSNESGGPNQRILNNNFPTNPSNQWRSAVDLPFFTIQSNYSNEWRQNISTDPKFVNEGVDNYHLQSNSGVIDKGAFLTTVVGGGTLSTLTVVDASYFTDGFGIVGGDTIQFQNSNETVQIVGINKDLNTLTLSRPVTVIHGQGVSLLYQGASPDMGAFEYGQ